MQMLGGIVASKMAGGGGPSDATAYKTAGQGQQQQQGQFGMSDLMPPNPPTGVIQTGNTMAPIGQPSVQPQQQPQQQNSFVQQLMQQYMR